jgi:hypothetical protein
LHKGKTAQPQKAVHLLWQPERKTEQIWNEVVAVPPYVPLRTEKETPKTTDEENKNDVICFANPVPSAFLPTGKFGKDFRSILDDNKSTNGRWHVAISNEKHPIPIWIEAVAKSKKELLSANTGQEQQEKINQMTNAQRKWHWRSFDELQKSNLIISARLRRAEPTTGRNQIFLLVTLGVR